MLKLDGFNEKIKILNIANMLTCTKSSVTYPQLGETKFSLLII